MADQEIDPALIAPLVPFRPDATLEVVTAWFQGPGNEYYSPDFDGKTARKLYTASRDTMEKILGRLDGGFFFELLHPKPPSPLPSTSPSPAKRDIKDTKENQPKIIINQKDDVPPPPKKVNPKQDPPKQDPPKQDVAADPTIKNWKHSNKQLKKKKATQIVPQIPTIIVPVVPPSDEGSMSPRYRQDEDVLSPTLTWGDDGIQTQAPMVTNDQVPSTPASQRNPDHYSAMEEDPDGASNDVVFSPDEDDSYDDEEDEPEDDPELSYHEAKEKEKKEKQNEKENEKDGEKEKKKSRKRRHESSESSMDEDEEGEGKGEGEGEGEKEGEDEGESKGESEGEDKGGDEGEGSKDDSSSEVREPPRKKIKTLRERKKKKRVGMKKKLVSSSEDSHDERTKPKKKKPKKIYENKTRQKYTLLPPVRKTIQQPPQKNAYTPKEDAALIKGVREEGVGHWAVILEKHKKSFHPSRTNVSLKDRWRILGKRIEDQKEEQKRKPQLKIVKKEKKKIEEEGEDDIENSDE